MMSEIVRHYIESLYEGSCNVVEYQKVKDPITKKTDFQEVVVLENQPCKLSYGSNKSTGSENVSSKEETIKLFLAPEVDIKAGSKIIVTQRGRTVEYSNSSVPAIFSTIKKSHLNCLKGGRNEMGRRWGNVDYEQLLNLQKKMQEFEKFDVEKFCTEVSQELAQRLFRAVVKETPVGVYEVIVYTRKDGSTRTYNDGKTGGTLRRGWQVKDVTRQGNTFMCEIINPVEYASYVEYGHRQQVGRFVPQIGKKLKVGWVDGQKMLTRSEIKIQNMSTKLIQKRLNEALKEIFNE